jgi:hypothetical protein
MQFQEDEVLYSNNFNAEPEELAELYMNAFRDPDGNSNIQLLENRRNSSMAVNKREMASVYSRRRKNKSRKSKRSKSRKNRSRK